MKHLGVAQLLQLANPSGEGAWVFLKPEAGSVFCLLFTQQAKIFLSFVVFSLRALRLGGSISLFWVIVDHSFYALFHQGDVPVQEIAQAELFHAQVGQELGFVDG